MHANLYHSILVTPYVITYPLTQTENCQEVSVPELYNIIYYALSPTHPNPKTFEAVCTHFLKVPKHTIYSPHKINHS